MVNKTLLIVLAISLSFCDVTTNACNEAVCASVVSKCMLTKSCKCDFLKNCSCCHDCYTCLGHLYEECCSCVDMCPKKKESNLLSAKSHVEIFSQPFPSLFETLTSEPDDRWNVYTFRDDMGNGPKFVSKIFDTTNNEQEVAPVKGKMASNCTVAYVHACLSWNKCRNTCKSTGANKFRWFHNGCCECIGAECSGFGSDDSSCSQCNDVNPWTAADKANLYYDEESEYSH